MMNAPHTKRTEPTTVIGKNTTFDKPMSTTRKALAYGVITAMLNTLLLPIHTVHAQEVQAQQAQQNQHSEDSVSQMIEVVAKHHVNKEVIHESETNRQEQMGFISHAVDKVRNVFFDSPEEQALQEASDDTSSQLLALAKKTDAEHQALIAELKQQKQDFINKGFDQQTIAEHDQLIAEMNKRYATLQGLIKQLQQATSDDNKQVALNNLANLLLKWQPKTTPTDMENLPWGTPKSEVRQPIVKENADINNVSTQDYKTYHQSAIGQWRDAEYKIHQYALNKSNISKVSQYSGMSSKGNWTVLKALPADVQAEDLTETDDIQITDDIKALAKQLDHSPAKIYAWVYDNIEFIPTYGSIQGSAFTLETKRGNATDTASLLIALLRASKIPARYVYGTVDVPAKFAMEWVGGVNNMDAVQNLVGQGGIPNTVVMNGTVPKYLRLEHVWVEANVDWIGSRGNLSADKTNNNAKQWIPLDATYKTHIETPGIDLAKAVPFDAEKLIEEAKKGATIDEATGSVKNLNQNLIDTAMSNYQNRVAKYLEQNHPNATVEQLAGIKKIEPWGDDTLPPMLPYQVKTVFRDYQELPDNMRHYFKFNLYENVGFLGHNSYGLPQFEYKIATVKLQGKPLAFSWIPENDAEQQKLEKTATADSLPINVWMKPELTLGDEVLEGHGRFRLGYDIKVRYGFQSPNSSFPSVVNKDMVVGEYHAIGYNMQGISQKQLERNKQRLEKAQKIIKNYKDTQDESVLENLTRHDITGSMLQATVQNYFATNDLQAVMQKAQAKIVQNSYMSFGTYTNSLFTIYRYGLPWRTKFSGMTMDIDRMKSQTVHKNNDTKKLNTYLKLQGQIQSANENIVPEKFFNNSDGISAAKVLKIAQQQGQKIYSINQFNKNEIVPKLSAHSAQTLADVKNALNAGREVNISERPIQFYDWKGSGYIIIDTQTGAGAYMLEGGTNGGWTKKLKKEDQKFISSLTYKKPRSISGFLIRQIVEEVIFNFIENLIENSDALNDCHKRALINFIAFIDATTLIYDVIGFMRFSIARIMLSAFVPLLVVPAAYATTRALIACNCRSETSTRSNSVRANNSISLCSWLRSLRKSDPSTDGKFNENDIDKIISILDSSEVTSENKQLILDIAEQGTYNSTFGIKALLSKIKESEEGRLSVFQTLRYANTLNVKNIKFEFNGSKNNFDADVAIFQNMDKPNEIFVKAVQLKTVTSDSEGKINRHVKKAKKQLKDIPLGTIKTVEINWDNVQAKNKVKSTSLVEQMQKNMTNEQGEFVIDEVRINYNDEKDKPQTVVFPLRENKHDNG